MNKLADLADRYKKSTFLHTAERFLSSVFFPVVLGAVILLCYYLGWDMVMIWFVALCAVAILLTCRDVTPVFAIFLFMNIVISLKNSPSKLGSQSDYFLRLEIYVQIIIAISLCIIALLGRLIYNIKSETFRPSPMFYGVCALGVAFLLSGSFAPDYTAMNIVYGLFLAAIYILIFMLVSSNISADKASFTKIAFYGCVFSIVLAIELIVAYATYEGLFVDGLIDRGKLFWGWGMYNTIGMLFCVCIPAWFYLAVTRKYSYVYTAFGIANVCIVFFTMSRQNILGAAVVGVGCMVWLLLCRKGRDRLINIIVLAVAAVAVGIAVYLNYDDVMHYISSMLDNIKDGGNRVAIWQRAVEDFLKAPIFGVGFYYLKDLDAGFVGLDIIPKMYHNTVLQMLGACGMVGLAAYAVHRAQTIISFVRNINTERIFIAISAGALLFVSLFDNHMFYIFPTILYVGFVGMMKASEGMSREKQTK